MELMFHFPLDTKPRAAMLPLTYAIVFSSLSFLFFGWSCLFGRQMRAEFIRYGLGPFRQMVGGLQLLGAFGLLLGPYLNAGIPLGSALGLCLLMLMGVLVRIQIKDTWQQALPALAYAFLNGFIAYGLWSQALD
jgi:hypothetical protein